MIIKTEIDDIRGFDFWSGARDVMRRLIELDKVDEVNEYLNECCEELTDTQLNDFMWFDVPEFFDWFTWD